MSDQKKPASPKTASANAPEERKSGWVTKGVAVGIGSAAIVAALLYANRSKAPKKGN